MVMQSLWWLAAYVHRHNFRAAWLHIGSVPIGAWKWHFPPFKEIMTDWSTDLPTDRPSDKPGHREVPLAYNLKEWLNEERNQEKKRDVLTGKYFWNVSSSSCKPSLMPEIDISSSPPHPSRTQNKFFPNKMSYTTAAAVSSTYTCEPWDKNKWPKERYALWGLWGLTFCLYNERTVTDWKKYL